MKREIRRDEFLLELLSLHTEACKLGLLTTAHALGCAARSAVDELVKLAERKAQE